MIRVFGGTVTISNVEQFVEQLEKISNDTHIIIQVFNAEIIYGKNHLISATEHALRAHKQQRMTANSLAMEILLYASGERQLKLAIPKMGIKKGQCSVAFVMLENIADIPQARGNIFDRFIEDFCETLEIDRDDTILEGSEKTLDAFGITEAEKRTVTKAKYGQLILEKVAFVDIIK